MNLAVSPRTRFRFLILLCLGFGFTTISLSATEHTPNEKLDGLKAFQVIKAFQGTDGSLLSATVLREVGGVDRLPKSEEGNFLTVATILLVHMDKGRPAEVSKAATRSLRSLIDDNQATIGDTVFQKVLLIVSRQWVEKVMSNPDLRREEEFRRSLAAVRE